jgi:hypothetical protein
MEMSFPSLFFLHLLFFPSFFPSFLPPPLKPSHNPPFKVSLFLYLQTLLSPICKLSPILTNKSTAGTLAMVTLKGSYTGHQIFSFQYLTNILSK